jgi:hypothetical protein
MSPQVIKPYVKGNKNDANVADAICEAVGRPNMRFVPVKSSEQQARCLLIGGAYIDLEHPFEQAGSASGQAPSGHCQRNGSVTQVLIARLVPTIHSRWPVVFNQEGRDAGS